MRRAYHDYQFWMVNEQFVGVSLGYDFTAEHEWGIEDMRRAFGIPPSSKDAMGVVNRTITKCPDNLIFKEEKYKGKKCAILYMGYKYRTREESEKHIPDEIKNYKEDILRDIEYRKKYPNDSISSRAPKDPIVTAWDGGTFGIGVVGTKEVGYLNELYVALQNKNVAIASVNLAPGNPFSNASLSLLIRDRIPQESIQLMYAADKKHYDLLDYEEEIGMKEIKENARRTSEYGKLHYYMACSPRWIDYEDPQNREEQKKKWNTQYNIQYWINYSDDDNNFGWYTVEEIKEWLTSKKKLTEIRRAYNPAKE